MQVKSVIFFVVLATIHAFPATEKDGLNNERTEVHVVPLEAQKPGALSKTLDGDIDGDQPIIDLAAGEPVDERPFFIPFPNIFQDLGEMIGRMRQQMSQILNRLPERPDSEFPELHLPHVGDIDLGKGNTTSITKIIDGHKVTINETEYKHDGEDSGAYFKIRIIDVKPESSEITEKDSETITPKVEKDSETITPKVEKDRESVEDTIDNEIPKNKEIEAINFDNIETFDEVGPSSQVIPSKVVEWNDIDKSYESFESNDIDYVPSRDLSRDIYVNDLMADAGVQPNPDAEIFDAKLPLQYAQNEKFEKLEMSD